MPESTTPLLAGKTALITGANRGIGLAIARAFARQGAHVLLNGRSEALVEQAVQAVRDECGGMAAQACCFDVSDGNQVKLGFQRLYKTTKRLDVLVNNAGVLEDALIGMATEEQIRRVFSVNTFGVLYCSQYAARLMARQRSGSIINLSSIVGVNGNAGQAVYSGSKAAVIGITRSLAKELAPQNIRCNAIAPGLIDTDMARALPAAKFAERQAGINMRRIGRPEEVADVAVFLASDMSSYVTGQIVGVDGGMLI